MDAPSTNGTAAAALDLGAQRPDLDPAAGPRLEDDTAVDVELETDDLIHIEDSGAADAVDPAADHEHDDEAPPDPDLTDCIDAVAESFNARDLDGLLELLRPDCETPGLGNDVANAPEALEDLWARRPSCCLTRGDHDGRPVAVLWELDGDRWWRVASVHLDDIEDGQIGVLEFADDAALLDEAVVSPPDLDLEEGARWVEWDEGGVADR